MRKFDLSLGRCHRPKDVQNQWEEELPPGKSCHQARAWGLRSYQAAKGLERRDMAVNIN